ncbi:MAG TPA: serine hydrolase, partial [Firmicutes bacterium]|nr:serine hydrolase [Bacillota bacterium]
MNKTTINWPVLFLALAMAVTVTFYGGLAGWPAWAEEYLGQDKNMTSYRYRKNFEQLKPALQQEIELSPLTTRLCLYDFATGEWIGAEENQPVYPASLIKTLYLLAALEQVDKGNLSLEDTYMLTEHHKYAGGTPVAGSGTLQFAPEGKLYSLEELLSLMISISDNIAANMVLDLVGPEQVADLAYRLGLKQTRAARKMFDLNSTLPSNRSTAKELTRMLIALQKRQVCNEHLTQKAITMMEQTEDKGRIGLKLAGSQVTVANKIGTVSEMIGDMALLYFPDRPPVALT